MRKAINGSPETVRTTRKTRPEIVVGTGTLRGKPFNGRSPQATFASDAPVSSQLGCGIAEVGSEARGVSDLCVGSPVHLEVQCMTGPASEGCALTISRRAIRSCAADTKVIHARVRLAGAGAELEHRHLGPLKPAVASFSSVVDKWIAAASVPSAYPAPARTGFVQVSAGRQGPGKVALMR